MGFEQQLFEQLKKLSGSKTLLIGIGNTLKADDGAGPIICQKLKTADISADLIDTGTVPENYIQPIVKKAPDNLIIIDAVDFNAPAGAIKIFEPHQLSSAAFTTHTLSPHLFIDTIRSQIEVDIYFIGIQPANLELGQSVSPEVDSAIQQLVNIFTELFAPEK